MSVEHATTRAGNSRYRTISVRVSATVASLGADDHILQNNRLRAAAKLDLPLAPLEGLRRRMVGGDEPLDQDTHSISYA